MIVPAFNEQDRIKSTLTRLNEYLSAQEYSWSVVVVSDGSTDATPQIVSEFATAHPGFKLKHYARNRGKGHAVKFGMLHTDARFLLLSDADLASPIEEVEKLWPHVRQGTAIAIGSRPLRESQLVVRQPLYRELLGRAFNKAVQTLAIKGIQDTQCGFKLFESKAAKDIFSRCKIDGFGYDFEALFIARDLGYSIAEVPIQWAHQDGSKVKVLRDGTRMILDLIRLRTMGKKRRLELGPPVEQCAD